MDLRKAASEMSATIRHRANVAEAVFASDGEKAAPYSVAHLVWMCDQILLRVVSGEKAHRWLGFIQGVCVARGLVTLEECKNINHTA